MLAGRVESLRVRGRTLGRTRLAVAVALVSLASAMGPTAGLLHPGTAFAICAAPTLSVAPDEAAPGSSVSVQGSGFMSECRDMLVCTPPADCSPEGPAPPEANVAIAFVQSDRTWELAVVNASSDYTFDVTVTIPEDAEPGPASFTTPSVPVGRRPPPTPFTVAASDAGTVDSTARELPVTGGSTHLEYVLLLVLSAAVLAGYGRGIRLRKVAS